MPVTEIAKAPVAEIGPHATVAEAATLMEERHVGALAVVRDAELVGMVTDRDVTVHVIAEGRDPATTAVAEIMTPEPAFVRDHAGIYEAIQAMRAAHVRRLPVVDDQLRPVGMVSADDLVLYLAQEIAYLARALTRGLEVERATK
ncbi:MAG: CBS domain-containing protein [Nitrospirae bacterium]|nr:MAG: CBS domain-containing protein [Nitrospirota bacterium]